MADIFISWGSPDREAVEPLRDRLRELALDVWEYSEDMGAGDQIQPRVMNTIEQARVAILCLSEAAVESEWVMNEIAMCVYAQKQNQIEHIIPVKVGALPRERVPVALNNLNLFILDLADPLTKGENLERLINDINEKLAEAAPLIMPAAIFAMNEAESMKLFTELRQAYEKAQAKQEQADAAGEGAEEEQEDSTFTEEQAELWRLCTLVGMEDPPDLYEFLQKRYGKTPEDMTPFESDRKIIEVINEIVAEVNKARVNGGHRPIFLRWVTDQLFKGTSNEKRIVRNWWGSRDSLLIIDSVSTFHRPIREKLVLVKADRSAVLWLPPYTQHTAGMEQALRTAADVIPGLGDELAELDINPNRSVSFDTSTSLALQVWLRRALLQVSDKTSALVRNVEDVSARNPSPGEIGGWIFRRKGGRR